MPAVACVWAWAYHDLGTEHPENIVAEQPSQENGCRREAGEADKSNALRVERPKQ